MRCAEICFAELHSVSVSIESEYLLLNPLSGWSVQLQLLGALAGVELALTDVGYPVTLGSGVAAAQAILSRQTPSIASRL